MQKARVSKMSKQQTKKAVAFFQDKGKATDLLIDMDGRKKLKIYARPKTRIQEFFDKLNGINFKNILTAIGYIIAVLFIIGIAYWGIKNI